MSPADPDRQPGLQAERTGLAWQRTGLGVLGIAALLAHSGPTLAWTVALLLGVALLVAAEDRLSRIRRAVAAQDRVEPARALGLGLMLAVVAIAAVGVAVVLR